MDQLKCKHFVEQENLIIGGFELMCCTVRLLEYKRKFLPFHLLKQNNVDTICCEITKYGISVHRSPQC